MKLIVGLGNPGPQYAHTRHNIGFMVADKLAELLQADAWRNESKFKAEISQSDGAILAKPQTMMNLSGEAIQKLSAFYKIAPADIWVVFDDVDTPFGRLRVRVGGSSSGHQGVNSAITHIGPNFVRVKIGISLNDRTVEPSEVYVLKPFDSEERQQLPNVISGAAKLIANQIATDIPAETTYDLL